MTNHVDSKRLEPIEISPRRRRAGSGPLSAAIASTPVMLNTALAVPKPKRSIISVDASAKLNWLRLFDWPATTGTLA